MNNKIVIEHRCETEKYKGWLWYHGRFANHQWRWFGLQQARTSDEAESLAKAYMAKKGMDWPIETA